MHLELVELLRCPNDHASSVLVAAADVVENRYVVEGLLGCPECLSEYQVRSGVTHFVEAVASNGARAESSVGVDHDTAMRLAAQLGISAGRTVFALVGYEIEMARAMREIVAARLLVFNAPRSMSNRGENISTDALVAPLGVALCGDVLPLVARKFDGIAIAQSHDSVTLLNQAVTALRPGARLVAPVSAAVPAGVRELVRDDRVWVAEKENQPTAPIPLIRR